MGEDRRPNVAGRTPEEPEPPAREEGTRRDLDAKALRRRSGADGHEGTPPAEPERDAGER